MPHNQHACPLRTNTRCFTLIELLLVLIIASVLMALLYTVILSSRSKSMDSQAKSEVKALALAIQSYRSINGFYPGQTQGVQDAFYLNNNMEIIRILTDNDPRGRVHLRVPINLLTNSTYCDPWGFPYAICMDENNDNAVSGLDFRTNRPDLQNIAYTNIISGNVRTLTLAWTITNNVRLDAPIGVFSTKGLGSTLAGPPSQGLKSWD